MSDVTGSWAPSFSLAFKLLCLSRLLAAIYSNISDCDEVFNYWEPTHYLQYGLGLQTWEYSPVYAIRSWAYALLHSTWAGVMEMLVSKNKPTVFYETRGLLAIASATTEACLVDAVVKHVNPKVGRDLFFMLFMSTGLFVASTAYLPSTFAMYAVTLATAVSLEKPGRLRTYALVLIYGVGSLLGWPFSAAAGTPFAVEELFLSGRRLMRLRHLLEAIIATLLLVLGPMVLLDSTFYRKLVVVPLNLVLYNVFSGADKGPDIFGTEPWWFYLLNGSLNFNVLFPMYLLALPLQLLPANVMLGIFSLQPHKEERFLFVVYPLICFNASIALFIARSWIQNAASFFTSRTVGRRASRAFAAIFFAIFTVLSLSRTLALYFHYHAPLDVYPQLHYRVPTGSATSSKEINLCVGKEWYRFPSHYFLPDGVRLRFLKSSFDGLLPKYFEEHHLLTHVEVTGMNDQNIEAMDRYVPIESCDFVIDYTPPNAQFHPDAAEPLYSLDEEHWVKHYCKPFLDSASTARLARAFYVPGLGSKSWGEYCLLKRRHVL
ncbi:Alg9-like mannosyltransferase family-domain-containing protein [Fimicolochytrium jonesii]|uniref:Alg9-like mannosyltransferase family-domain-containing protein n=1 Tax=Fimicolochytrium jonesii TaxID=1396493 RepID=UPI0022FE5214|nr:Alg9-like mannosyltransferase family-domain-containing protein [Fimicolochytrium jonesii]KAI8826582.1 Alg9-like mannosyltransferase family-domain-containing protein [Fimicolochytrium jonesii]